MCVSKRASDCRIDWLTKREGGHEVEEDSAPKPTHRVQSTTPPFYLRFLSFAFPSLIERVSERVSACNGRIDPSTSQRASILRRVHQLATV